MKNTNAIAEQLRQLTRMYVETQKNRIKFSNQSLLRGKMLDVVDKDGKWGDYFKLSVNKYKESEQKLKKKIEELVKQHPWGEYFLKIKGIGPVIAGSFIGELNGFRYGTIEKGTKRVVSELKGMGRTFESTCNLWAYAGYGVIDGQAQKRKAGEMSNWNKYLKLTCFKFAESFIKVGGPYRDIYDKRKEEEQKNHADLTKMHIHRRSMRYAIKKLLSNINHDLLEAHFTT